MYASYMHSVMLALVHDVGMRSLFGQTAVLNQENDHQGHHDLL